MQIANIIELLNKSSDVIGIIGVSFILTAFYCLNTNKLFVRDLKYQLLNLVGSWLILFSLLFHWNLSSVIIEIAWINISLIGLYKAIKNRDVVNKPTLLRPTAKILQYHRNPTSVR